MAQKKINFRLMIRFLIQLQRVINYRNFFLVFVSLMAIFTLSREISAARASHDWLHFLPVILALASMWLQAWARRKLSKAKRLFTS